MENKNVLDSLVLVKKFLPSLISNLKDWLEFDLSIKLCGITVFAFHWPPKASEENPNT